ncbi:MAG: hypothetical protein LWW85_15610, partial [Marinilabiliales bacterium]|nr:hypothetical protein [Marinilabiliales bacterium]
MHPLTNNGIRMAARRLCFKSESCPFQGFLRMRQWLWLLLALLPFALSAEIPLINNLSFDFFSQEQGLSNNQIHCVYQDKKGWMWVGTSQGLCRFDGYRFTLFKSDPDDPNSLKGNLVRTICEDSKGQLWVGTEIGGLNKFDREKETFRHVFYDNGGSALKDVIVSTLLETHDKSLWVGTDTRLYRIRNEQEITRIVPDNLPDFSGYFRAIREEANGRLWLGTSHGLYLYDPQSNKAERIRLDDAASNQEIWVIEPFEQNQFLIGTYASGLFMVNTTTLSVKPIVIDAENDRSLTVRAISKAPDGRIWIGTRGGLYQMDSQTKTIARYIHDDREPKSLVNNSVLCVSRDRSGNLWIGTRQGLNLLVEERINIQGFKAMQGDNHYLNNGEIYCFLQDPAGELWIGTENGGINILNRRTGQFRYLLPQKNNPNSLSSNCIKALIDDGQNNILVGTYMGGLDIFHRQTGTFSHFRHNSADATTISDNRIWCLLRDSRNDIWVGTSRGIDKFDPKSGTFLHYTNLVDNKQVNWLAEDKDHNLWIGADDLIIYNLVDQKIQTVDEYTRYMLQDSKGRYWLTTQTHGLALFSKEKGILQYFNEKQGLANNQTLAALEDNEHYLWISTTNGLSKFDPERKRFHTYSTKNGFQND